MFLRRYLWLWWLPFFWPSVGLPETVIELESGEAAPGHGSAGLYDESNATFVFHDTFNRVGALDISITPNADSTPIWRLSIEGPGGQFPGIGTYPVQRYPFQGENFAGGDIGAFLGCNRGQGSVEVLDVEYTAEGVLSRIAADLRYACTNSTRYATARLRFHSPVPLAQPAAHAVTARELLATPGNAVSLDGSMSFSDDSTIGRFQWEQLEGDPVELAGANSPIASFVLPADTGDFQVLLFRLTVEDLLDRSDSTTVQVITGENPDNNIVTVVERGNNFVWQNEVFRLDPLAESYRFLRTARSGVEARSVVPQFILTAPYGVDLTVGGATQAQRLGSDFHPNMQYLGCNYEPTDFEELESYFDVLDLQYDAGDSVVRLAFDFRVRCSAGNRNTFEGHLRYNSYAPEELDRPQALAGGDRQIYAGEPAFLNGILSRALGASIAGFQWSQVSGPPIETSDADSAIAKIIAPVSITESSDATFRLDVTDSGGRRSSDILKLEVTPVTAPRTFFLAESDDASFIGQGISAYRRNLQDTTIPVTSTILSTEPNQRDYVSIRDKTVRGWSFDIYSATGTYLEPGTELDTVSGDPDFLIPTFSASNTGRGCGKSTGRLNVLDVTRAADNTISSLAVDFEHTCQFSSGSERGSIRYRSAIPMTIPLLSTNAGPDIRVTEGQTIELVDPSDNDVRTRWVQTFGPEVKISDQTAKRATFVAPTIPAGQSRYLAFRLINQRSGGGYGTDLVVIRIDDNGLPDWDAVGFEKYVDIPHAYSDGRGGVFGFRAVERLGNLSSVGVSRESLQGTRIDGLAVTGLVFPVIEASVRRAGGSATLELFSQQAIPTDYVIAVLGNDDQWRSYEAGSTGDGVFSENGWNRLAFTIPSIDNNGIVFDRDDLDESITTKFAIVQLGAVANPPPPNRPPSGGGGGGGGACFLLAILLAATALNRWIARSNRPRRDHTVPNTV